MSKSDLIEARCDRCEGRANTRFCPKHTKEFGDRKVKEGLLKAYREIICWVDGERCVFRDDIIHKQRVEPLKNYLESKIKELEGKK